MVEGVDDENVVKHLCAWHHLPHIEFAAYEGKGGVEALIAAIPVQMEGSDVEALGIMLDADTDVAARWAALRTRLQSKAYKVPSQPEAAGTVIEAPKQSALPRMGVWLMPDNRSPGALEDFLLALTPTESPLFQHVEQSVATIPPAERRFKDADAPKARMHTWLAWQKKPGKPFGTAIGAGFLDAGVPPGRAFAGWLRRLFFPESEV